MPTINGITVSLVHGIKMTPYEEHLLPTSTTPNNPKTTRAIVNRRLPATRDETAHFHLKIVKSRPKHRATAVHIETVVGHERHIVCFDEVLLMSDIADANEKAGLKFEEKRHFKVLPHAAPNGFTLGGWEGEEWFDESHWDPLPGVVVMSLRFGKVGKVGRKSFERRGPMVRGSKPRVPLDKERWGGYLQGEHGEKIVFAFLVREMDYDIPAAITAAAARQLARLPIPSVDATGAVGVATKSRSGSVAGRNQDQDDEERAKQSLATRQPRGLDTGCAQQDSAGSTIEQTMHRLTAAAVSGGHGPHTADQNSMSPKSQTPTLQIIEREVAPSLASEESKPRTQLVRSTISGAPPSTQSVNAADEDAEWETASSSEEDSIAVKPTALALFGSGLLAKKRKTSVLPKQISELSFPKLSPDFAGKYDGGAAFLRPSPGLAGDNPASVAGLATEVPAPTVFAEYAETPQVQQHVMDGVRPTPTLPAHLPELAVQNYAAATTLSEDPVKAADLKSEVEDFTFTDDSNKLKRKATNMDQDDEEEEALKYEMAEIALKKREMEVEKRLRELAKRRRMVGGK
ncbi:hypothetical protein LTR27_008328 [Elasticomyces elasticus]|nr:hypothetical protein LTR27_008328 [Elasticomyces elasticus]